ncbi:MAG: 23S rRNA (uracil(1939)-C(5))-methyltransferase RlmD [Mycoplasmatales bacterium]
MLKKNDVLKNLEIIDYTHEGMGVCKVDGVPIFVKYAKKGQSYDVKLIKIEKKFAFAKIEGENKDDYICPHFKKCGGCHVMHLDYQQQVDFKKGVVENIFNKFKLDTEICNVVENENPLGYRNKILMPFTLDHQKQIKLGFFKERSHDIEIVKHCFLQSDLSNDIAHEILTLMKQVKETVYDEDKHQGNLRHLFIREGFNTNEIMVCFVLNGDKLNQHRYVVESLTTKFPQIKSIVINVNKRKTNAVLGFKNFNLYNSNFITEKLEDSTFRLLPNAFFQINTAQTEKMYNKIVEYANISEDDNVLDAYCGVGSITHYLAKKARHVVGIEISEPAIKSANDNKKLNKATNIEFICNDIEKEIQKYEDVKKFFDVVVVDPPRKGIEDNFIDILNNYKPKTIVYVSCNPATLARDLTKLETNYNIVEVTPFDLFSQTYHVETVCKLTLK